MVYGFVKLFLFVFSVNMLWLFVGFFYGKYGFDFFILRKFVGDLVWFVKKNVCLLILINNFFCSELWIDLLMRVIILFLI